MEHNIHMEIFFDNQTAFVFGEMLAFIALGWWFGRFMETTEMLLMTTLSVAVTTVLVFTSLSFVFTIWSIPFFGLGFAILFTLGFYGISWYVKTKNPYP